MNKDLNVQRLTLHVLLFQVTQDMSDEVLTPPLTKQRLKVLG
jgi:hypothetical protein